MRVQAQRTLDDAKLSLLIITEESRSVSPRPADRYRQRDAKFKQSTVLTSEPMRLRSPRRPGRVQEKPTQC